MRLFKSSEYAIRCLVYMAAGAHDLCTVKQLSDELKIPYKFLARLMTQLGAAGIVEAVRGKHGGYRIARPLDSIHVADIVDVVEGLESYDRCILGFDQCDDAHPCALHGHWTGHKAGIMAMMHDVSLTQMIRSGGFRP
jgi:Rrf2 family protein